MRFPRSWRITLATLVSALTGAGLAALAAHPNEFGGGCGVHLEDFSKFQICFGYPITSPPGINCAQFDFDGNGVIDLRDFAARTFVLRVRLLVFPARALTTYSQTMDFNATVVGPGNPSVNWTVSPQSTFICEGPLPW